MFNFIRPLTTIPFHEQRPSSHNPKNASHKATQDATALTGRLAAVQMPPGGA